MTREEKESGAKLNGETDSEELSLKMNFNSREKPRQMYVWEGVGSRVDPSGVQGESREREVSQK